MKKSFSKIVAIFTMLILGCSLFLEVLYEPISNRVLAASSTDEQLEEAVQAQSTTGLQPVYRLYCRINGEHLYTTDLNECKTLYSKYGWGYEGIGWYSSASGKAVYRLYHPGLKNHLYTLDLNEVRVLCSSYGWVKDNNGKALFYSDGSVPIYRVYNPSSNGLHHLTTDKNEYQTLPKYGWKQEGIKIKASKIGEPIHTQYYPKTLSIKTDNTDNTGNSGKDVTRIEWIRDLTETLGVEESSTPDKIYYSDVSKSDRSVIAKAVDAGILTPSENTKDKFNPSKAATRDFVAVTSVKGLGFMADESISCTDVKKIANPKEAKAAVDLGILSLQNGKFNPDGTVKNTEISQIRNAIKKISDSSKTPSTKNKIEYQNSVKTVNQSAVKSSSENKIIFNSSSSTTGWKKGTVAVIGDSQAIKVSSVQKNSDGTVTVSYTKPDISEVVKTIDVSGAGSLDFGNFEPASGVTVKNLDGTESAQSESAEDGISGQKTVSIEGKKLEKSIYLDSEKRWKLDASVALEDPSLEYDIDIDFAHLKVNNVYVQLNEQITSNIKLKFQDNSYQDGKKVEGRKIQLGSFPVTGLPKGIGIKVDLYLYLNAKGEATIETQIRGVQGVQVYNNTPRVISNFSVRNQASLGGELKAGPQVTLSAFFLDYDLLDFNVRAGVKVAGSVTIRPTGMVCMDGKLTVFGDISAFETGKVKEIIGIDTKTVTFWNDSNSPIKLNAHFEDLNKVDQCTYNESGRIIGSVVQETDHTKGIPEATVTVYSSSDNSKVKVITTDSNGQYNLNVKEGTYRIVVEAPGYQQLQDTTVNVMKDQTVYAQSYMLISNSSSSGSVSLSGKITDSTTGTGIGGVKIKVRKNWNQLEGGTEAVAETGSDGSYVVSVKPGYYTVSAQRENYIDNSLNITVGSNGKSDGHLSLTPKNQSSISGGNSSEALRIVLRWYDSPSDLDSHLISDENSIHVYYSRKSAYLNGNTVAWLDVDDTSSFGPETITIENPAAIGKMVYAVHNYSGGEANALSMSACYVQVYRGDNLIQTFQCPNNIEGEIWNVFRYDASTNKITPINTIGNSYAPSSAESNLTGQNKEKDDFRSSLYDFSEKKTDELNEEPQSEELPAAA